MKTTLAIVGTMLTLSVTSFAADTIVYNNDFQGTVGTEWSRNTTSVTPIGARQFLGQFWNDTVTLSLSDLPEHQRGTVTFDLFILKSWDGNVVEDPNYSGRYIGPDKWMLDIVGGARLVETTFCNHDFYNWMQSYPSLTLGGSYIGRTGAVENNTLGYTFGPYGVIDSVYRLTVPFSHSGADLDLAFSASLIDWFNPTGINNESWGIDNVQVSVSPVPEPASFLALFAAMAGLGGFAAHRRQK